MSPRGVLLGDGGGERRRQILVPPGIRDDEQVVVGRCTVPGCGARFYAGEEAAWQRHVGKCARANLDRIHAVMEKPPMMDDFDPEVTKHLRGVGERMLEEGRLEVKPSERAGFS